jgi:uncharacterized phiE125 gp8 family phage protein
MNLMNCRVIPSSNDEADPLISLEDLRLHCSVVPYDEDSDGNFTHPDDTLLQALLLAAIERAEDFTGLSIQLKSYEGALDEFPEDGGVLEIPNPPLVEIISISYGNDSEIEYFYDYALDDNAMPARVKPLGGASWPTFTYALGGVRVTFDAGYDSTTLPNVIRQALLLMVGDWYKNREDSTDKQQMTIPNGAMALLRPRRVLLGFA